MCTSSFFAFTHCNCNNYLSFSPSLTNNSCLNDIQQTPHSLNFTHLLIFQTLKAYTLLTHKYSNSRSRPIFDASYSLHAHVCTLTYFLCSDYARTHNTQTFRLLTHAH